MKTPNKNSSKIIATAIGILILAFLAFAAVMYAKGAFDISFINRHAGAATDEYSDVETLAPVETAAPPEFTNPDDLPTAPAKAEASELKFADAAEKLAAGATLDAYTAYSAESNILAEFKPKFEVANVFSYRKMYVETERAAAAENGGYETVTERVLEDRKTITLYAGYIIYDCGGKIYLCNGAGEPLVTCSDKELTPAYSFDGEGRALFESDGRFCYYDDAKKSLVELNDNEYIQEIENIGLYFEHSASYGKGMGESRYRNSKHKWSFINSANDEVFKYYGLYNFSESLAAAIELKLRDVVEEGVAVTVTDEAGNSKDTTATVLRHERNYELNFLNTNGTRVLTGDKTYMNESGKTVISSWCFPLYTRGNRAMGYLYFENGLCRVREITMDATSSAKKIYTDTDYIIKSDGSRFPLPAGYSVVSYSSGMILLEKDGKYGYMNYKGEWAVQPVFSYAEPYFEGLAVVALDDGKYGMIDTDGNYVIPLSSEYISNAAGGIITLYDSSFGWKFLYKLTVPEAEEAEVTETAETTETTEKTE